MQKQERKSLLLRWIGKRENSQRKKILFQLCLLHKDKWFRHHEENIAAVHGWMMKKSNYN